MHYLELDCAWGPSDLTQVPDLKSVATHHQWRKNTPHILYPHTSLKWLKGSVDIKRRRMKPEGLNVKVHNSFKWSIKACKSYGLTSC